MTALTPLELLLTIWTLLSVLIFAGGYAIGLHSPRRAPLEIAAPEASDDGEPAEVYGQDGEAEPEWPEVAEWDTGELLAMRREQRDERRAALAAAVPNLAAISERLRDRLADEAERAEWAGAWRAGQDRARAELYPAPPAPAVLAIPGQITTPVRQLSPELLAFAGLPLEDSRAWWDGQAAAAAGEGTSDGRL